MTMYNKTVERPRAARRFVTAIEVREMNAAGVRELAVGPDTTVTDEAREIAADLGMRLMSAADGPEVPEGRLVAEKVGRNTDDEAIIDAIVVAFERAGKQTPAANEVREVVLQTLERKRDAARRST